MNLGSSSESFQWLSGSQEDLALPADIWRARRFIHQHFAEELSLTQVARAANINPTYLSEKFKQVTGINFVEYIARVRCERACSLLKMNNRQISEIGFTAGFQSLSQFNRVFKRLVGTSPTQYRTLHEPNRASEKT